MSKMRPIIFVTDQRICYEATAAMAELEEVLRVARGAPMENEICVLEIGYGGEAELLTDGEVPLSDYTWSGGGYSMIGGNITPALSLLDERLGLGQDRFENPLVVFFTAYEPWDGWREALAALDERNELFCEANRIAICFGGAEDTDYLGELAGWRGFVADDVSLLKQFFSLFLLGHDDPALFESSQKDYDNNGWGGECADSGWGGECADSGWGGECADSGWGGDCADSGWGSDGLDDGWGDGGSDSDTATGGGITLEIVDDLEEDTSGVAVSDVQFSAVSPKQITKGDYAMIDITVYEESYRHIVDSIISGADTPVKETFGGSHKVQENAAIRIVLSSPDVDVSDCDETQLWQGKYLVYSFPVEVPANYAKRQILLVATVYFNGVIATRLKMIASCQTAREQKLQIMREDVISAFISYASQDRSRVATIIQGMKKARPDMDIFFDVESLRSGEDWGVALRREIEARDVLYLCWSHHAKLSHWVEAEWRYALSNKGLDAIEPIPLEPPSECPPPEELNSKHFNDRTLLYQ